MTRKTSNRSINHRSQRSASYEVLIDNAVKWRGQDLGPALRRLSRQYPRTHLTIRWIPGPELLVVIQTV